MRTLILGFDAFDPNIVERLIDQGRLPGLRAYAEAGGYARFKVSNPSQSEVSWTSIATGLNPGGHGIFDFVHRDPRTYSLHVSLLPTKNGIAGSQFGPPFTAKTIFDQAVQKGYPATTLWWPATFPAKLGSPVQTIPGLGTPDVHGRLGVGTLFTTDIGLADEKIKTHIESLRQEGSNNFSGKLLGPSVKKKGREQETSLGLKLELITEKSARLFIGDKVVELEDGKWSPIIALSFKLGLLFRLQALTRVILTARQPDVKLYFLPLQLHPLHSPWPYSSPRGFIRQTWQSCGPFLTIGWPQDTIGLEEGWISDRQFLALCESIFNSRRKVLWHHLQKFNEGLLAVVFDSLDRIQHMLWRDRPDIIEEWYVKMDALVTQVARFANNRASQREHLIIVSDHGFADYNYKVHLNRWLIERSYLFQKQPEASKELKNIDWSKSQTYAIGLNSVYLNLAGREGQGIVNAGEADHVLQELRNEILNWRGPDGRRVVQQAIGKQEALEGSLAGYGPDMLIGYSPGYRASSKTGLGEWEEASIEPNQDHWNGDHCIDPACVPGVLFSSQGLHDIPNPSYQDIPELSIGEKVESNSSAPPPPTFAEEDEEVVKERLKSLGYF